MVRTFSSRSITAVAILSLLFASTFVVEPRARGAESSDRALAQRLADPGTPLDPVLSALSAGRLVRNVAAPLAGQVKLPPVRLGFALTGAQLLPLDVTGTPEATRAVDAFVARLRSRGIETGNTSWTVYTLPWVQEALDVAVARGADPRADDPLGSRLIVPAGTAVELVGAVWENEMLYAKTTVSAAGRQVSATEKGLRSTVVGNSADWVRLGGAECLDRDQNSTAHYDPCQWFYKFEPDRDASYDYWASQYYGTGKSHSIWTLRGLEADGRRRPGTAHQEWVDWDPGADAEHGCRTQTVSVSYAGVGVSIDKQHCELWDIDKGAEAADLSNWWRGDAWRTERETAAETATRLREGEVPQGDFDFYAYPR